MQHSQASRLFSTHNMCLCLVLAAATCMVQHASAGERPNVMFFAVDDMCDWVGPLGDQQAVTPNMDALARSGVTFTNAHIPGTYCAPSRAAIFTVFSVAVARLVNPKPTAYGRGFFLGRLENKVFPKANQSLNVVSTSALSSLSGGQTLPGEVKIHQLKSMKNRTYKPNVFQHRSHLLKNPNG